MKIGFAFDFTEMNEGSEKNEVLQPFSFPWITFQILMLYGIEN